MNFPCALAVSWAFAAACVAAPAVTKVEPPNWWAGQAPNPVRLLIHGAHLEGSSVHSTGGLSTSRVRVNDRGTYVFVDVNIPPNTPPGSYPLELRTSAGAATIPFRIDPPLPPAGRFQGFSPNDVIYLIMPDRFANGDPSNDDPAISKGLFDRANPRFYHGGDLQGIIDHLPYLKQLGITALWLTPVYDNTNLPNARQSMGGKPVSDYHGYGTVDYYGIEEHFGTFALLRKLVDAAHSMGIKIIQDQVANHVGPSHPWVSDPPTPTWFHGAVTRHLKETFDIWQLVDPHSAGDLRRQVLDGWFADVLPDMNQEDPEVTRYEIQNALWWVATAGFDGIRQDTLPYVPRQFWREWSTALKHTFPNLTAVGEVFDANPVIPSFFQGGAPQADGIDTGIDSVFDFPAYFAMRDVFAHGNNLEALAKTIGEDKLYPRPDLLSTFLGNHDVKRFMSEPGVTPDSLKLAFTFLLTARGIPVIYYGDEIGMPGGDDPDNRRDFPGGWPDDASNAFLASGRTPSQATLFDYVRNLTSIRAATDALRTGSMTTLLVQKQLWVYRRQHGSSVAIVAINNDSQEAAFDLAVNDGDRLRPLLHPNFPAKIVAGKLTLHVAPRTAEILTNSEN